MPPILYHLAPRRLPTDDIAGLSLAVIFGGPLAVIFLYICFLGIQRLLWECCKVVFSLLGELCRCCWSTIASIARWCWCGLTNVYALGSAKSKAVIKVIEEAKTARAAAKQAENIRLRQIREAQTEAAHICLTKIQSTASTT